MGAYNLKLLISDTMEKVLFLTYFNLRKNKGKKCKGWLLYDDGSES